MYATMADAHREWHANAGVPMGTPGCPQDACHLPDPYCWECCDDGTDCPVCSAPPEPESYPVSDAVFDILWQAAIARGRITDSPFLCLDDEGVGEALAAPGYVVVGDWDRDTDRVRVVRAEPAPEPAPWPWGDGPIPF